MSVSTVARAHYERRQVLAARSKRDAHRAWATLDQANLEGSWLRAAPALVGSVSAAQVASASMSDSYLDRVLAEQGLDPDGPRVNARAFGGLASDGRPLASLLHEPIIATKARIGTMPLDQALNYGRFALGRIVYAQVIDAGRVADGAGIVGRRSVTGYYRYLTPPSCGRCAVLAGAFYRYNAGFKRHPFCFPAGTVVSGPRFEAATRRWFQGELVRLTTASGQFLTLTGNHPVLTSSGWLPANLLDEGSDVVRSTRPQGAAALVVPDHHEVPSLIEDVWGALSVRGLARVPSAPEDFHGDGQYGKVDVAGPHGSLADDVETACDEHVVEQLLAGRIAGPLQFALDGEPPLVDLRHLAHPDRAVRGGGLALALSGSHLCGADLAGLTGSTARYAGLHQPLGDDAAGDAVLPGEGQLASSGGVRGDDLAHRQVPLLARWDAPSAAFSMETRQGYARAGRDLLHRLAGQVELDRVVELSRTEWSGHVYSLTSSEGWHVANSLIVSNCDCVHVAGTKESAEPVRTDPRAYFDSLSEAEQNRHFTVAGAEAIRDGADIGRVVNARRGMTAAGTTTAGFGGQRIPRRLMPESIYRQATSRAEARNLLVAHGYLI